MVGVPKRQLFHTIKEDCVSIAYNLTKAMRCSFLFCFEGEQESCGDVDEPLLIPSLRRADAKSKHQDRTKGYHQLQTGAVYDGVHSQKEKKNTKELYVDPAFASLTGLPIWGQSVRHKSHTENRRVPRDRVTVPHGNKPILFYYQSKDSRWPVGPTSLASPPIAESS